MRSGRCNRPIVRAARLNRGAHRHGLVRRQLAARHAPERLRDQRVEARHAARAADHQHFVKRRSMKSCGAARRNRCIRALPLRATRRRARRRSHRTVRSTIDSWSDSDRRPRSLVPGRLDAPDRSNMSCSRSCSEASSIDCGDGATTTCAAGRGTAARRRSNASRMSLKRSGSRSGGCSLISWRYARRTACASASAATPSVRSASSYPTGEV